MKEELLLFLTSEAALAQKGDPDGFDFGSPWYGDQIVPKKINGDTLKQAAVRTEDFDVENGYSPELLLNITSSIRLLKNNIKYAWINQKRDEFTHECRRKLIPCAGSAGNYFILESFEPSMEPLEASISAINTILESMPDGFIIVCSPESAKQFSLCGDNVAQDKQSARWEIVDGEWRRVPFMLASTEDGQVASVNERYFAAPFEDMIFSSGKVIELVIPNYLTNEKDAPYWLAHIECLDENGKPVSIESKKVHFFAKVSYIARVINPYAGAVLRYRRATQKPSIGWQVAEEIINER